MFICYWNINISFASFKLAIFMMFIINFLIYMCSAVGANGSGKTNFFHGK